jgi:hypothetical protein
MNFDDFGAQNVLLALMPAMKTALLLVAAVVLNACVPLSPPAADAQPLSLAQQETRECQRARVVFPAGTYTPEIKSERGTYYVAPAPVRVEGVLIGGGDRGGVFIANDGRHAAWFGDARDDADDRAGTLLGAMGASAPKLWLFSPTLPLTPATR